MSNIRKIRYVLLFSMLSLISASCGKGDQPVGAVSTIALTPLEAMTSSTRESENSTPVASQTEAASALLTAATPVGQAMPQPAAAPVRKAGEAVSLDHIWMFDTARGWAVSGGVMLVTADGAQTWREASPPASVPPGSQVQIQGVFLDALTGWVLFSVDDLVPVDAVVWHTTDSGTTWTPSASLGHEAFGEIVWAEFSALDQAHVWLMVRGVYAGAGTHYAAQFFRTQDGGLTWNPIPGDVGVDYTGLVYADLANGLLAWQTAGNYAPYPPEYALTSDGGLNWDVRQLPPPPDAPDIFDTSPYCEPFQPHMFSAQSIKMLVGCFDYYDPPQVSTSYLYASADGGSTWTITGLPEDVPAWSSTLFFFDEVNGLLLSRDLYRTTDGGENWEHIKSVNWDGQFTFIDSQNGWAIARAEDELALVKTTDGGELWSVIKPVIAP